MINTLEQLGQYGPWLAYVPHKKQLVFHQMPNKIRALVGGNRSGKTVASTMEGIWTATGTHPFWENAPKPPVRIRICGPDYSTVIDKTNLPMFKQYLPKEAYHWWAEKRVLEFWNGSLVFFQSYDQPLDKFGGQSLHLVIEDEEPPEAVHVENMVRLMDVGGRLVMTYTPMHGMTWSYNQIYMNEDKDKNGIPLIGKVFVRTIDNPTIPVEEIEYMKQSIKDPDLLEAKLNGTYFSRSGLCIPEFDRHYHGDVDPKVVPPETTLFIGIDHNTRNEEAVVFVRVNKDGQCWVVDEIYEKGLVSDIAAKIIRKIGNSKPACTIIDTNAITPEAITGRNAKTEYARHGVHTIPAKKGHGSVNEGIDVMREYFREGKLFITRNCPNLTNQLSTYRWEDWTTRMRDRRDPKERPVRKEVHAVDALRYIIHMRPYYRSMDKIRMPDGYIKAPDLKRREPNSTGYF